jgi:hypothetical protein
MVDPSGFSACDDDGLGNIKCDVDGHRDPSPPSDDPSPPSSEPSPPSTQHGGGICDPQCPQLPSYYVPPPRLPGTTVSPIPVSPPSVPLILQSPDWVQIPQSQTSQVGCGTALPNGQTVGQVVNQVTQSIDQTMSDTQQGGGDPLAAGLVDYFFDVNSNGPIDFKTTLGDRRILGSLAMPGISLTEQSQVTCLE